MRAVCVARHRILSEHLCAFFAGAGVACVPAVGFDDCVRLARAELPDVVLCDYDVLVCARLEQWADDADLAAVPMVAVSLTRRADEAQAAEVRGLVYLYLPQLTEADAASRLRAAVREADARRGRPSVEAPDGVPRWEAGARDRAQNGRGRSSGA